MNKKITLQDIIEGLIQKHSMERKDAEAFVKGMFDLIEDTLSTEKIVKIKGFGTFKLIEVDSRESINVNSGERFKIEGHSKVSFTPDASLKNIINKPFSHFETVILNENTNLENTDVVIENPSAITSDDSSEDIQTNTNEEPVKEVAAEQVSSEANTPEDTDETPEFEITITSEETTVAEEAIKEAEQPTETEKTEELADTKEEDFIEPTPNIETAENTPIEEVSVVEEAPVKETPVEEAPIVESHTEETPVEEETAPTINEKYKAAERVTVEPAKPVQEDKKSKNINIILYVAIAVIIGFACFLFYILSDNSIPDVKQEPAVVTDTIKAITDTATLAMPTSEDSIKKEIKQESETVQKKTEEIVKPEVKAETKKPEIKEETSKATATKAYDETILYKISGTKAMHTIQDGEGLMKISLKYYGTKKLYNYILEYNKGVIGENGDKIRIGMNIKIPELRPL